MAKSQAEIFRECNKLAESNSCGFFIEAALENKNF